MAPSRFGIKFANKSEEQRYLRIVAKINQIDFMDTHQFE